jgi:hypothetical protein
MTTVQFPLSFSSNTFKHDLVLHLLRFLLFTGKNDREADNYDQVWNIGTIFDTLMTHMNNITILCRLLMK